MPFARTATVQVFRQEQRRDPTVNDDETLGFYTASTWFNLLTRTTFTCRNPIAGNAWWEQTNPPLPPTPTPVPPAPEITLPSLGILIEAIVPQCTCTAAEQVGRFVYIAGARDAYGRFPVRLADPGDRTKMPAYGLVTAKVGDTLCTVQTTGDVTGILTGLDTSGSDTYMVDYNGTITRTRPALGPSGYTLIQIVGIALDTDMFRIQTNFKMSVRTQ